MLDLIKNELKPKLEKKIADILARKIGSNKVENGVKLSNIKYYSNFYLDYEFELSAHNKLVLEDATKSSDAVPLAVETQICYDQPTQSSPAVVEILWGLLLNPTDQDDMDFQGFMFNSSLTLDENLSDFANFFSNEINKALTTVLLD